MSSLWVLVSLVQPRPAVNLGGGLTEKCREGYEIEVELDMVRLGSGNLCVDLVCTTNNPFDMFKIVRSVVIAHLDIDICGDSCD